MRLQIIFLWVIVIVTFIECLFLAIGISDNNDKISNLQQQIAAFQNIHICEDRSHETCDGDCDCDGLNCDTL